MGATGDGLVVPGGTELHVHFEELDYEQVLSTYLPRSRSL